MSSANREAQSRGSEDSEGQRESESWSPGTGWAMHGKGTTAAVIGTEEAPAGTSGWSSSQAKGL